MKIHAPSALLTIAAFALTNVLAQAQTASADSTVLNPLARNVQRYYNQNQVDSIYAMVGESFKQAVTIERMKTETNNMRSEWGQWKSMNVEEIREGTAHYTAQFEKATIDFFLGLGKDGKANTIFFKPRQKWVVQSVAIE